MKKIKVLLVAVLVCCAVSVSAQDSYDKAVLNYMSSCGGASAGVENLTKMMVQNGDAAAASDETIGQLRDAITKTMTDAFKNAGCTEEDINTVSAALATPEGKDASANLAKALDEKNIEAAMSNTLQAPMMAIMQGQTADPVPAPEVAPSYKTKFHACYNTCNIGGTLVQAIDAMKAMLGDEPEAKKVFESLGMYLALNGENIMLTPCKDILTEANLETLNAIYSTPSGKKVMAAQQEATKSILAVAMAAMKEKMK